jgi:hypothetical protein
MTNTMLKMLEEKRDIAWEIYSKADMEHAAIAYTNFVHAYAEADNVAYGQCSSKNQYTKYVEKIFEKYNKK